MMFTHREDFLSYVITGNYRLNKYDYKFLNNLLLLVGKNKFVTSNQNQLFEKLLVKYKKQLQHTNINFMTILSLKWNCELVETGIEYTEAFAKLLNNTIELRVPFSKNFINALTERLEHNKSNDIKWDFTKKCYTCNFSTINFKIIYTLVPKFFKLNLCDNLQQVVDKLSITAKYFNPTYVKIKNNYYVLACNEDLYDKISHITFDDDPINLFKLSWYGITISESVTNNDEFLKFVGEFESEVNLSELGKIVDYALRLGIDTLVVNRLLANATEYKSEIFKYSDKINIIVNKNTLPTDLKKPFIFLRSLVSTYPMRYKDFTYSVCKVITMLNDKPVNL